MKGFRAWGGGGGGGGGRILHMESEYPTNQGCSKGTLIATPAHVCQVDAVKG